MVLVSAEELYDTFDGARCVVVHPNTGIFGAWFGGKQVLIYNKNFENYDSFTLDKESLGRASAVQAEIVAYLEIPDGFDGRETVS